METEEKEICENCIFSEYDFITKLYVCACEESENYGLDNFDDITCECFEIRLDDDYI